MLQAASGQCLKQQTGCGRIYFLNDCNVLKKHFPCEALRSSCKKLLQMLTSDAMPGRLRTPGRKSAQGISQKRLRFKTAMARGRQRTSGVCARPCPIHNRAPGLEVPKDQSALRKIFCSPLLSSPQAVPSDLHLAWILRGASGWLRDFMVSELGTLVALCHLSVRGSTRAPPGSVPAAYHPQSKGRNGFWLHGL